MRERWYLSGLCVALLLQFQIYGCLSLNLEGFALLAFRSAVEVDPHGIFQSWNPNDINPCNWSGVYCADGRVEALYLAELSLMGVLAPELGKISRLRAIVLHRNNFTGVVPQEIGGLSMLELLDLRGNNLYGTIPRELGEMPSLKCLLLCDNKFEGGAPSWIEKLDMISDLKPNSDLSCEIATEIACTNRKVGQWLKVANNYSHDPGDKHSGNSLTDFVEPHVIQSGHENTARRRLLQETTNYAAVPVTSAPLQDVATVPSGGSGSFPAIPKPPVKKSPPPPSPVISTPPAKIPRKESSVEEPVKNSNIWVYILIAAGVALLLLLAVSVILVCCRRKGVAVGPWKTGLSGQLQKAFVTGVPKLDRSELEVACEDFSNIIATFPLCTLFKGTLSSGTEIGVLSSTVKSANDWPERSELRFRKKVDTLSRVNHKNFINLLGHCEEEAPFTRMMVFEYQPNGTLFDHLHVSEYEHLDWSARMRVIMGIAYCLQYMHHELNPPVALSDIQSTAVFITDDFAAKIVDLDIFSEETCKKMMPGDDEKESAKLLDVDPENNVYSFGVLMLEIISGKFTYSEDGVYIVDWASEYLNDEQKFSSLVDSALKTSNETELQIVCQTIRSCLGLDLRTRPTMKEVTMGLKEVLGISPEAAFPRSSPLWWAELEILSVEAS